MTYIDFQIDVGRFLAAQRTYLRRLALCPPVLPAVAGLQLVVDRVDIGRSSLRHDEPATFDVFYVERGEVRGAADAAKGFRTVLAQQLTLQFTTDADIRSHPNGDPPLVPWQVTVHYELSADSLVEDCYLRARPLRVEFGPPPALPVTLPPAVVAILESFVSGELRALAPSGAVAMGLEALDLPTGFLNAGVSVDTAGTTLTIRVEIRAAQNLLWAAWQNFYSGHIVDRRHGKDWVLFVPAAYITHRITSELWHALPKDDDLEAYPGAAYVPLPGRARFDIDVLLIYHAVQIDQLDIDITVSADPTVQLSLWVDRRNRLSAEIDFAGLVNPVGTLSTLAVALIDASGIPARSILYRLVGSAIVDELKDQPVTAVTQPTSTTVRVDKDVAMPASTAVVTAVTDLLAHPDGIGIAGDFTVHEPTNAAVEILGVSPFDKHVPEISCGAATMALVALFGQSPETFGILGAGVSLGNRGTAPLHLCGPPVPLRLDGPVQPRNIRVDEVGLPIHLSINIGLPTPAYYAAPFPVELMVRTNGGTRCFRFDPPPVVTQGDLDRIQAELLVRIADCNQLVDPWFKGRRGYNPHWSPRPPEGVADLLHHWEVVVSGLPEDERVELRGPDGRVLGSAPGTGPAGTATVAVVVEPVLEGREVGIVRVGDVHPAHVNGDGAGRKQGLQVRQTDLIVLGEIPLAAPCHAIGLVELPDGPALVALLPGRVEAFDVRSGAVAGPLASWRGRFRGMLRSSASTLLYGEDGVARLDALGRLTPTVIEEPVLDAARGRDGVYLVTADQVLQFASDLSPAAHLDRAEVSGVVALGSALLLAHQGGIDQTDSAMTVRETTAQAPLPAARALERAGGLRRQGVLAAWGDGTFGVLEDREGTVVRVAHYESRPLLAGSVRVGDRVIVQSSAGDGLRVLTLGRHAVL